VTNLINFISKNGGKIPKNHKFFMCFFPFSEKNSRKFAVRKSLLLAIEKFEKI